MRYQEITEAASSVQVPNLDGTYKKFRSLDSEGVNAWRNSHNPPGKEEKAAQRLEQKQQLIKQVAGIIQKIVEKEWPGNDPHETIYRQLLKLQIYSDKQPTIIKQACQYLGYKSIEDYLIDREEKFYTE